MDTLILIDAVNAVPEGFRADLREVGGIFLEKTAAGRCLEMLRAARYEGIDIKPVSGYRSREYQQVLWNRELVRHLSAGLCYDEAVRLTGRYLARVGHSEHETGLAVDFCLPDDDDADETFSATSQGRWLAENAHGFGFILRYPRMKESITGIAYEPWHFRYTGLPHSSLMKENGLTLEEYLYYYR